jgi:hypothetical protein
MLYKQFTIYLGRDYRLGNFILEDYLYIFVNLSMLKDRYSLIRIRCPYYNYPLPNCLIM